MATANAANPWVTQATNQTAKVSEVPSEDNHPAALVALIDLGSHEAQGDNGAYVARKVLFCWELVDEQQSDGSPFIITKDYAVKDKLGKKSGLRQMLESWQSKALEDGQDIDLLSLIGRHCMIGIAHKKSTKDKTYAVITSIGGVPKALKGKLDAPQIEPFTWHISTGQPFVSPEWLPYLYGKSVSDTIAESVEMRGPNGPGATVPVGAGDTVPKVAGDGNDSMSSNPETDVDIPW